jgi:hypothetical protein
VHATISTDSAAAKGDRIAAMFQALALLAILSTAQDPVAQDPAAQAPVAVADTTAAPAPPPVQRVQLHTRNPEAERVLNAALTDAAYWKGANASTYNDKTWDEIRLKQLNTGYVAMISGEGGQDFDHDVVVDVVYAQQTKIPQHTDGAKAVVTLGSGVDPVNGAPYTDTFFFLDFEMFYGVYSQRMYRETDDTGRTVLWYEKLDERFVDPATWAQYQQKIEATKGAVDRRWVLGSVIDVGDIFGMFIVEAGHTRKSRVTFITKIVFASDSGWIAKTGSQLPVVIKAGLKSGFRSCVELAQEEQRRHGG